VVQDIELHIASDKSERNDKQAFGKWILGPV
jgi:hypothetical protein